MKKSVEESYPIGSDEYFMREALKEATVAYDREEVPIGAVVVSGGRIIGRGHNLTESLQDVTAHAEMIAITAAQNELGTKVLPECTLYVTIEPCAMCAGAMRWARLARVVWGANEEKVGFTCFSQEILHPRTEVKQGVLGEECRALIQAFFADKRH